MSAETMPKAAMFAAIAKLQADLPRIAKGETAQVRSDKGNYSYKYADLADVAAVVLPRLAQFGLGFLARPTLNADGKFVLAYSLVHESGEREDGEYPLTAGASPQATGSAITYARRYCLCAVTGTTPDGDDDGKAAEDSYRSAGAAFESASPVRPAGRPVPEKPVTTDTAWLDEALRNAADDLDTAECRKLWVEAAEKVKAGTVAKEDAKRVQDILKARIEDLGREAKRQADADEMAGASA